MESDADRLESIKALGGRLVVHDSGEFWAIYDDEYVEALGMDSSGPALTARTSDVHALRVGTVLQHADGPHKVNKHQRDGTGMTVLLLKR